LLTKDTVLFDLDGTLLPIELEDFLNRYFRYLTAALSDLFEADHLIKAIMKATDKMLNNDGERLNSEVFKTTFFKLIRVDDEDEVMARFDRFYERKFPLLREGIPVDEKPARLVNYLKEEGYQLIVATNPVFPLIAIRERLKWLNLNPDDFMFITSYENMHYCKPNIGYYKEILKRCSLSPQQCIMVGNDPQEDMVASELGITTFLVTDYLLERDPEKGYKPDWKGSFQELIEYFHLLSA